MKHKGYTLRQIERAQANGKPLRGCGIFLNDVFLTSASDSTLARRVVDEKIRTGLWKFVNN